MKKQSRHKSMFLREKSSWLKMVLNNYVEISLLSLQNEISSSVRIDRYKNSRHSNNITM